MKTIKHLLTATLVSLTALTASAAEITVYTALEDDEIAVYLPAFQAAHPDIKVNLVRDSTGIITARLLAERENPQADVIWGTAATSLLVFDELGMLAPHAPAGLERIRPFMRDQDNEVPHWVGIKAWVTGIISNTIELRRRNIEIPRSYADLIKPEFRGLLTMPNPASSGTGFLTVSAILQLKGEEAGWAFLDALHENMAQYTHSGSAPARMAGRGEFPVGISFAYRGFRQKAAGEPVEVAFPAEGSGYDIEANALVRKPRIHPAARTFLDWAVSDEAMRLYAAVYPIIATDMDVEAPEGWPEDPMSVLIENDLRWAAANRQRILDEWTRRYDGKSQPRR